jgi:hypothetical protein
MRQARKTQHPPGEINRAKILFPVSRIISMYLDEGKLTFADVPATLVRCDNAPNGGRANT